MTFTYTISDEFVWSDGVPVTAEDVAYTLNLYKSNHAYLPQNYLTLIDGDVRRHRRHAHPVRHPGTDEPVLGRGPLHVLLHPAQARLRGDREGQLPGRTPTPARRRGTRTSPASAAARSRSPSTRSASSSGWSGTRTGPAPTRAIDEIIYRFYKNDDALAQALQQGELDFATSTRPNIFNSLKDQPNIGTMVGTIPSFSEIGLNTGSAYQEAEGDFTPHGDGHPALTDVTVRRAIRMAINSEELVDKVLLGYGVAGRLDRPAGVGRRAPGGSPPATRSSPGTSRGRTSSWRTPATSTPTATASARCRRARSTRDDRSSSATTCGRTSRRRSTPRPSSPNGSARSGSRRTSSPSPRDGSATSSTRARTTCSAGAGTRTRTPDAVLSWMKCDQRPPDGTTYGNDDSYYCNPEYDQMYLDQQQALDVNDRWDIVHEMQKIFYEDAAYSVMWYDPYFQAYRTDRFTGYNPQPPPNGDLLEGWGGISDVWLTLKPVSEAEGGGGSSDRGSRHLAARVGGDRGGPGDRGGRPDRATPPRRATRTSRRPAGTGRTFEDRGGDTQVHPRQGGAGGPHPCLRPGLQLLPVPRPAG